LTVLRAGSLYFMLVFTVGWVLGPIRELLVVPRTGRTVGVLLEAPLMGQPMRDYLAGFVTVSGGTTLLLFLVFAAMPAIVMRCEACGARSSAPRRSE
jgi:hypothetical protein